MKKILLSAGEVSGDLHGSYLVKSLKKTCSNLHFYRMGGAFMRQEGVDVFADLTSCSTVGFLEPLKYLLPILRRHILNH